MPNCENPSPTNPDREGAGTFQPPTAFQAPTVREGIRHAPDVLIPLLTRGAWTCSFQPPTPKACCPTTKKQREVLPTRFFLSCPTMIGHPGECCLTRCGAWIPASAGMTRTRRNNKGAMPLARIPGGVVVAGWACGPCRFLSHNPAGVEQCISGEKMVSVFLPCMSHPARCGSTPRVFSGAVIPKTQPPATPPPPVPGSRLPTLHQIRLD